jgi:hypothetical protein
VRIGHEGVEGVLVSLWMPGGQEGVASRGGDESTGGEPAGHPREAGTAEIELDVVPQLRRRLEFLSARPAINSVFPIAILPARRRPTSDRNVLFSGGVRGARG